MLTWEFFIKGSNANYFMEREIRNSALVKEAKSCSLPGCTEKTTHNGGYCCAEHCKEHRRILREEKR